MDAKRNEKGIWTQICSEKADLKNQTDSLDKEAATSKIEELILPRIHAN